MNHRDVLAQMLPAVAYDGNGPALNAELTAEGQALDAVAARAESLYPELFPSRFTPLTLADWEALFGLPDSCCPDAELNEAQRIARVYERATRRGGLSKRYLIERALTAGYVIDIEEPRPFRVGVSAVGESLNRDSMRGVIVIKAADTVTVDEFRVGESRVGEPLRRWGICGLECLIEDLKPAHVVAVFSYGNYDAIDLSTDGMDYLSPDGLDFLGSER